MRIDISYFMAIGPLLETREPSPRFPSKQDRWAWLRINAACGEEVDRLFVLVQLERGTRKEYPELIRQDAEFPGPGATDGGMTRARVGVRQDNYSLPSTEPDAGIRSHVRPATLKLLTKIACLRLLNFTSLHPQ